MSFHEKLAWVMATLTGITGIWYANSVVSASRAIDGTLGPDLALISIATIVIIGGAIVSSILLSIFDEAETPELEDERDRFIFARSGNYSGWVFSVVAVGALWHYFFQNDGNALFHMIIGAMFASSVTDFALQILFYRRGG